MNYKKIRDYTLMTGGFLATGISTAFIVAEMPAILIGGAGIVLAVTAMNRLDQGDDCCDAYPNCNCND